MKAIKIFICLTLVFSLHVKASTEEEINYLLKFVAATECQYERNGEMHNGVEAVAHIKKKYKYYAEDIKSTEDFIEYSATKSKMSGKYYKIHCKNKAAVNSQHWLLTALKNYRQKQR